MQNKYDNYKWRFERFLTYASNENSSKPNQIKFSYMNFLSWVFRINCINRRLRRACSHLTLKSRTKYNCTWKSIVVSWFKFGAKIQLSIFKPMLSLYGYISGAKIQVFNCSNLLVKSTILNKDILSAKIQLPRMK